MPTDPTPRPDPPAPITPSTHYHAGGRVTVARDRLGAVTWTTYDADGQVVDRGPDPPPGPPEDPPDDPHVVG